jgi:hypothetical protein
MDEVSEAEILTAAAAGHVLDCNDGGARRVMDAALLRRCCHELSDQIDPYGVRLRNAVVGGSLDLTGLNVPFPLRFEGCEFDSPPVVEGAQLYDLALTGCIRFPGLLANGVQIRRDLDLSHSRVAGTHKTTASTSRRAAVWLCESDIGGRLLCVDTVIHAEGERAIHADRMHAGGAVRFLRRFSADGEIRLLGARIDGSLDLSGAHVDARDGVALDLSDASVGGSIFLIEDSSGRRTIIRGRIDMGSARVSGQFLIRSATLAAPAITPTDSGYSQFRAKGTALSAPRLTVGAEITFEKDCDVSGGIDLSMSALSSLLIDSGCSLRAPGHTVIDLTNAELMSTFTVCEKVPIEGTIRLTGTRIHGNLCLRKVKLSAPEGESLVAAEGARIDGETEIQGLDAAGGQLTFRAAAIGSNINASGARLHNPEGYTLSLVQTNVKGSVRLTYGFESTGKVVLNRAVVDGRLLCMKGTFDCPSPTQLNWHGHAIEAISASINGMDLGWQSISPSVDFTNTRTSFLADNPDRWPDRFVISGFTYERLEQPQGFRPGRTWDHTARCAWLRRQVAYDAGPYEQAARVFRQHGYSEGARAILIAQRKHARSSITGRAALPRRALDTAYSLTVGYGYRPARVLWLITALLIFVAISLQIPGARAAMRATTAAGTVYTTKGPLQPQSVFGGTETTAPQASSRMPADACGDGQVRCFNPILYAIDTVIPLVSLDQRSTWYPDTSTQDGVLMQWWLNAATILGWLLSSILVLSLAGLARSP